MKRNSIWIKSFFLAVAILVLGLLLLMAVYMLPVGRMKSHVADSDELFNYEGIYPQIIQGYKTTQLDNYTDGLMYATAIHPGTGNPVKDAMRNARYEYENTNMVQSLNDYANDVGAKESLRYEMIYPRYWHGYLVILKPLLLFFNVSEIRMLNMILQGTLFLLLLFLVGRKLGERFQIPVVMMAAVLNPIVLPLSQQFSWVYYIALAGAVFLLCMKYPFEKGKYILLFLAQGMATSYIDLLTYPLITLGLPLVLLLLSDRKKSGKKRMVLTIQASVIWAVGYAVMWLGKWIFAWMFGGGNLFREVTSKIMQRTSMVGEEEEALTLSAVLGKNIQVLLKWPYQLMLLLFLIICFAMWRHCRQRRISKECLLRGCPYLVVMLMPVVWIGLMANHSWTHYWFTYRELSVTVLAGAVWILEILVPEN